MNEEQKIRKGKIKDETEGRKMKIRKKKSMFREWQMANLEKY